MKININPLSMSLFFIFLAVTISSFILLNPNAILNKTLSRENLDIRSSQIIFKNYMSGDAKFISDNAIITSKTGYLHLINVDTKKDTQLDIKSNWVDCIKTNHNAAEKIIAYSNSDGQTGICKIDKHNKVTFKKIVLENTSSLHIDPSLLYDDGMYYLTSTNIVGNVNNSNPNVENGLYTVELYKSSDLSNWQFLSNVVSYKSNIEDVELYKQDGVLRLIFEKEQYDKGKSSLRMINSYDNGVSWKEEKELIPFNADNEVATFLNKDGTYWMFYSSDIENPTMSYTGAKAYITKFDKYFNQISTKKIDTDLASQNILLYEADVNNNEVRLLYSHDYLGSNDLCIEKISLDSYQ